MSVYARYEPTSEDKALFRRISELVRARPAPIVEAGKWLDDENTAVRIRAKYVELKVVDIGNRLRAHENEQAMLDSAFEPELFTSFSHFGHPRPVSWRR